MSVTQEEADRLRSALTTTPLGARFDELYAAQQALAWATDPEHLESPLNMIRRFSGDTAEGSTSCLSELRPV